jgi:hypothetical protein
MGETKNYERKLRAMSGSFKSMKTKSRRNEANQPPIRVEFATGRPKSRR